MTTARDTYNQLVYAKEQGLEEGRKEGEAKGREEGKMEKAVSIARKMLTKGMDVDSIAELTELTPQEIEASKEVQMPH